ncbi:YwqJ-related putative deaminase [Nocardiopsis listeri]|uniref:YwqJ-related putative deaminase n=1 Tax=Nocardiopsis listeri TaxID=53440 RepID=UPI00082F6AE5|nr:YwqJ-related putative deaminase [Nocardiopsis listeri]
MPIADPGAGAATPADPLSVKEQEDRLRDGEGVISPLTFPEPSVSVGYVEAMASGLRELGTSIADTGNDITGSWAGLNGPYSAPEAETLFSVLDPVATDGDTVGEELDRAARALENFAEDVADIKTRWSNLRVEAYDLRSRIAAEGDGWDKGGGFLGFGDSPLKEENDALIERGGKIITDYTEVENTCANAINAGISGRTNFEKQPEGDAELDPNVFYHGFDQDISELAEAWGHENAQTDHGWWVDVSHAVWDFGVDAVQGVGAMVGAHSSEGWFQASWGDALKEYHWDNLTSAASLVGMYDAESDSLGWNGGEGVGEAWKDLAHSVVPWEEWGDRPGYVIGTAALNVIGLVGGAALTATGVGAVVGVPLMAWRGMSIMDGMGGSGRGGAGGVDIDLPDVSQVPQFGGSGSPLINLAGRALDATGFGPSQLADFKAMVNRLMPSGQSGVEPAGSASTQTAGETEGGRPSGARPTQATTETDQRPIQRPVQDPTVADTLAFDDIVNHPDNQAFGDQVRSTRQDQIDQVDRAAKTGSNGAPASEEGRWIGDAGDGRGPEGMGDKEPAMAGGGRPSDTMEASAARNTPAPVEQVRLTDVDGPGGGRPFGNEIAESRGDHGTDTSDRNPTVRNQDGDGSGSPKDGSGNDNGSNNIKDERNPSAEETFANRKQIPPSAPTPDITDESPISGPGENGNDAGDNDDNQARNEDNQERTGQHERVSQGDGDALNGKPTEGEWSESLPKVYPKSELENLPGPRFTPEGSPRPITVDPSRGGLLEEIIEQNGFEITRKNGLIETINGRPHNEFIRERVKERRLEINGFTDPSIKKNKRPMVEFLKTGEASPSLRHVSQKDLGAARGGVYSIVLDRKTGLLAEGFNGRDRSVEISPEDLHPALRDRLNKMIDEAEKDENGDPIFPHGDNPLRHAEVKATNELLLSRPDAQVSDFSQDTVFLFKEDPAVNWSKNNPPDKPAPPRMTPGELEEFQKAPCCANCSRMTDGVPSPNSEKFWFPSGDPRNGPH